MEILTQPNVKAMTLLGEQPVLANQDYRFMKYCLISDINGGKVIFNGLSRTLIFLRDDELEAIGNINDYEYLYKYYFLVPEDFDEQKVVDEMRLKLQKPIDDVYLDHPQSFTILTTTKCNARCFYCYELNMKKKHHMTEETAIKVGEYVSKVADRNKQIHLHWFGGEPMFNMKAIDIITQIVRDNGQNFTSTFTTNGYLFDKDLVLKAKNVWNTVQMQITLDGTEEIYNKVKNYIHKDSSPYKRVLNNIAILLNNGIQVSIRLNIDHHNAENLKELAHELYNRFKNHPKLFVYAWPIFENDNYSRTREEHVEVFKKLAELEDILTKYDYLTGLLPKSDIAFAQCMADDGTSVTISPDGDLGTCEHFTDSHFWGNIDNPMKKNFDNLNIWRDYEAPLDICSDCPIYPSCIRPSKCREMSNCDIEHKEWRIRKSIIGMIRAYKDIKGLNINKMPRKLAENVN
jgi:radical SAM protein with 4Fe4S-binding SPASM domain